MRSIDSSALDKRYVLEKVSQASIFAAYLGLPVGEIERCASTGELICNPLRDDAHPTAGFRYNNRGKLKFRDFGNDCFWGDCFDIAALVMGGMYGKRYDIGEKNSFRKVLRHITFTFKDIFYGVERDINLINGINAGIAAVRHRKPVIELVVRGWNNGDADYWRQFGVPLRLLNVNFVYPVEQYYVNRNVNPEPKYYYRPDDPCYGYYLGQDRNGVMGFKLYFPLRGKGRIRFVTNCNHLEGILNLDGSGYDYVVVTKSTKDRICLRSALSRFNSLYGGTEKARIGVINIPHETYRLRQNEYDWICGKLKPGGRAVSLMDNDRAGKKEALWLRSNYGMLPLLIPASLNAKDFAELSASRSFESVAGIILDTIRKVRNYDLEKRDGEAR